MSNHIRERSQSLKRSNRASQALKPLPFELQFDDFGRKCNPSQARNSLIQTCPRPNSEADRTLRHICSSCAIRSNSFTQNLSRLRDRQENPQKPLNQLRPKQFTNVIVQTKILWNSEFVRHQAISARNTTSRVVSLALALNCTTWIHLRTRGYSPGMYIFCTFGNQVNDLGKVALRLGMCAWTTFQSVQLGVINLERITHFGTNS